MKAIPSAITLELTMREVKTLLMALFPIAKDQKSPVPLNEEEVQTLARMYNQLYSISLFDRDF